MKISHLKEHAIDGVQRPLVWKVAAGAGAVLVVALIAAWALRPSPPPPLDDDPIELVRFLATPAFHALAEEQKQPYTRISQMKQAGNAGSPYGQVN